MEISADTCGQLRGMLPSSAGEQVWRLRKGVILQLPARSRTGRCTVWTALVNSFQGLMEVSNLTNICHMQAGESEFGAPAAIHFCNNLPLVDYPTPSLLQYRIRSSTAACGSASAYTSHFQAAQDAGRLLSSAEELRQVQRREFYCLISAVCQHIQPHLTIIKCGA